jgi:hypothetical protein
MRSLLQSECVFLPFTHAQPRQNAHDGGENDDGGEWPGVTFYIFPITKIFYLG